MSGKPEVSVLMLFHIPAWLGQRELAGGVTWSLLGDSGARSGLGQVETVSMAAVGNAGDTSGVTPPGRGQSGSPAGYRAVVKDL